MDRSYLVLLVGFFSWTSAQQLYCPGRTTISCMASTPVIWDGTAFIGQCTNNATVLQAVTMANVGETSSCGELNVTITNVDTIMDSSVIVTDVDSSLFLNAQPSLSGLTIRCRTGVSGAVANVDVELLIPDIPTPNVTVSQDSLTAVTVNLTVEDNSCASLYFVEITPLDSNRPPIVMSSSSPSVSVADLNLCMNNHSVVGYIQAPSGLQGGRSSPKEIQVDLQGSGLDEPVLTVTFTTEPGGLFRITVEWEPISMDIAPTRLYGFSKTGDGGCNPVIVGDLSGTEIVPASPGEQYSVCVSFLSRNGCEVSTTTIATVPPVVFNETRTASVGTTGFSVTVTLIQPMNPETLSILATIDPPDAVAVLIDYPTSSPQYTFTFEDLTPGRTYTYNIRVVLRTNSTSTAIDLPVIGVSMTGYFTVPPACGTVCVVVVAVVCVLVVVAVLCFAAGCGAYKYKNRSKDKTDRSVKSEDAEKHKLTRSFPPPVPDSLYADPNSIEHQAAPGTEDQYAMVDRKVKKNTKSKPTSPEALYQDPNTIEHQTAASGDTYAVVDKPKRSSKKKGGPDVVPPPSEGLTYADIDLSSKHPKPSSGRQAPQQPGEYPKEHPVEYSSVDHGNTSQL